MSLIVLFQGSGAPQSYTLTAAQGSYTETGQSAGLYKGYLVLSNNGSFSEAGQVSDLKVSRILAFSQGSYTQTGQSANLNKGVTMIASQGSYVESGQTASYGLARTIISDQGSYTESGQISNLLKTTIINSAQGNYTESGQLAGLFKGSGMIANEGNISLAGQSSSLLATRILALAHRLFNETGQEVALRFGYGLQGDQHVCVLLGKEASYKFSKTMSQSGGTIEWSNITMTISSNTYSQACECSVAPVDIVLNTPIDVVSDYYEFTADYQPSLPITVRFTINSPPSTARVFWSKQGSTTEFEALPTTIIGNQVSAQVSHFSIGFVAIPSGGIIVVSGGKGKKLKKKKKRSKKAHKFMKEVINKIMETGIVKNTHKPYDPRTNRRFKATEGQAQRVAYSIAKSKGMRVGKFRHSK